jgi:hypothetical protein
LVREHRTGAKTTRFATPDGVKPEARIGRRVQQLRCDERSGASKAYPLLWRAGSATRLAHSVLSDRSGDPMSSQHDKIESVLAALERRGAALGFENLLPHEQVALLAYSAHGLIARSGFKQFYEGTVALSTLVAALRAQNLKALANAAAATAALFPDPTLAEEPARRREHLASLNTEKHDYVFFRLSSEELLTAIESFWNRQPGARSRS